MLKMKIIQGEVYDIVVLSGIYGGSRATEFSESGAGSQTYPVGNQPCGIFYGI